ncbi:MULTISPECIES: hypothetical protein [Niastella]|uniref:Uncharacterized protein n=1 Tax=Niastella soli TaxID=2821487 RepID=A0ABS3Z5N7_9BACT|nr:hypothetical protein [Niastella soli]MBO9205457.1 hypothetical protein [Niastella soli]
MASYYDRVLEDFDLREASYDEGLLDEGILDEGIYDEGIYDEGIFNRKKAQRPVRLPGAIGKASNFGKNVKPTPSANGANPNYVTKAELKSSLNSISEDVNALKKTGLTLAATVKKLDDGYEKIVKSIARKDKTQDNILSSTTMMSLMSTLVNKPSLDPTALKIVPAATGSPEHIELDTTKDAITVDLSKTLLFTMLPTLMSSNGGGSSDNGMMMMMMVLLLGQNKTSNSNDNSLLIMLPMMMMMNNKKS